MVKKEAVEDSTKIIEIDDKKLFLVFIVVVIMGSLIAGNMTGNAGRISVTTELTSNEFILNEGGIKFFKGSVIILDAISEDGGAIIRVITENEKDSRFVNAGDKLYINGFFVTNVNSDYKNKVSLIRVE